MFIWFTVRVTGNVPPTVESTTTLHHTVSTSAQTVTLTAIDCNVADPADTGVSAASVWYNVDGGSYTEVPLSSGPSGWTGDVPGQPLGSTVAYYYTATDNHGLVTTTGSTAYRVVDLNRGGYTFSTPAFSFTDIAGDPGATELPGSAFFGTGANDDGTAGPVPIGGNFTLFGRDTLQYAFVGANGAIGMTGTATDTVWVNSTQTSSGAFANFSIPAAAVPRNFVAGFWNDLYLEPDGHGSVWYKQSGTQLIIQWNRVGNFNDATDTTTTFEIVLDRADNSVTINYLDVGVTGLETSGLVAMQSNSTGLWTMINQFGYPVESRPANNMTIKFTAVVGVNELPDGVPAKFALHANYPNPFNPTTSITYDVASRAKVELTIYSVLGEKIAELVNAEKEAGTYSATWDGRNLQGQTVSSGVYLARIKAGSFTATQKMMLLK
jgi:hypothetical protein